jgi:hypothetical protein
MKQQAILVVVVFGVVVLGVVVLGIAGWIVWDMANSITF